MNNMLIDDCLCLIGEIKKVGAANQTLSNNVKSRAIHSPAF